MGHQCRLPEVGHVDRDGVPDFMSSFQAMLGRGDGTFAEPIALPAGGTPGDFNGDGLLDLASVTEQRLEVLLGNGDGTFRAVGGSQAEPCR